MIGVLLVDDHPVVRTGYRRLLEQAGDIDVAEAGDGNEAYSAFLKRRPDVLVTDLSMTPCGGLELMRRVLIRAPDARILVFTMHDSALLVRRALEGGARGFLTKASAPERLIHAIRVLHAGERFLGPELPQALLQPETYGEAERVAALSAREFEIFRMLAEGRTPAECAGLLNLSPKTVANHQTTIKDKLNVSTTAALVHLAIRQRVIAAVQV